MAESSTNKTGTLTDEARREVLNDPSSTLPPIPERDASFMERATSEALRPFVIISSSYLLFTITDGAIRMIVLLHAYNENFSAIQVAIMFTLYEFAGAITNLCAGVMGANYGIKFTLIAGLVLQIFSFGLLFGWQDDWDQSTAVAYVTIAQMFAGIAKDLVKLGGKAVTKLVTPEEKQTQLYKLVSAITGWKNSLKGVGYFLGGALLQASYETALIVNIILVVLAMPWAILGLDGTLGMAADKKKNATFAAALNTGNPKLNVLSIARFFLFASRDFWFEIPLPFFLRSPPCDGLGEENFCWTGSDCDDGAVCDMTNFVCVNRNTDGGCGGLGMSRVAVGAFLGAYIILYGQMQSWTPQLVTGPLGQTPPNKSTEVLWSLINCIPTLIAGIVVVSSDAYEDNDNGPMTVFLVIVVMCFAVIFAVNSSIHSYLVVSYAKRERLAVSVGFYYMSNAIGRLFGTLGSGLIYSYVGDEPNEFSGNDAVVALGACFFAGTACSFLASVTTTGVPDERTGLRCGPCVCIPAGGPGPSDEDEDVREGEGDGLVVQERDIPVVAQEPEEPDIPVAPEKPPRVLRKYNA